MAWKGLIVKNLTKTELVRSSNTTWSRFRLNSYQQQVRCFRREAKRPETKKSNIKQETKVSSNENKTPVPPRIPSLFKPLAFTFGFTGCSFAVAAILQYKKTAQEEGKKSLSDMVKVFELFKQMTPSQQQMLYYGLWLDTFWDEMKEGPVSGIMALNLAVLCCWRIPSLRRHMIKYFSSDPVSKTQCLPLVLSSFSHNSTIHMMANMYVLWAFSSDMVDFLGKEQFIAFYLSAGVISTMVGHICKTATGRFCPSLGASGAVMAVLAATFIKAPQVSLSIIFLPMKLSVGNVLTALFAFEATGLIVSWRFFDHAAHLGGAFFGLWFAAGGHRVIRSRIEPFVKLWHSQRSKDTGETRPGAPPGGGLG